MRVDHFLEYVRGYELAENWAIEQTLMRDEVLMLTAAPGAGKTTLALQWAAQVAHGVHPVTLEPMQPKRVALLNQEDTEAELASKLGRYTEALGGDFDPDRLHVFRTNGVDLTKADGGRTLIETVDSAIKKCREEECAYILKEFGAYCEHVERIDVLFIGSMNRLTSEPLKEEATAKAFVRAVDEARSFHECGVILEAHERGFSNNNSREVAMQPYGSHDLVKWPSYGLHLKPNGTLTHWREPRVSGRVWPTKLLRDGEQWPWMPVRGDENNDFRAVLDVVRDVGPEVSKREVARILGVSDATVRRLIRANQSAWDAALGELRSEP